MFSIGHDTVQLTWRALDAGEFPVSATCGAEFVERHVEHHGGPGAVTIEGLTPGQTYQISIRDIQLIATTAAPPPGEFLGRIGSINDVHIGSADFGFSHRIKETPAPTVDSGVRCAEAAFDEMQAWGIDALFIKGDLVHKCTSAEWNDAERLLAERPWPIHYTLGNHERLDDARTHDGVARIGAEPIKPVRAVDLDGLRVIMAESSLPSHEWGDIAPIADEIVETAAESQTPVLLLTHHQLQPRKHAWMLPIGISGSQATPLLDRLAEVQPNTLTASGHTHRHRRREHGPVTVVEVGSPKDYPGTWSGYDIYEGGIRQVVRRVERPDCIAWTEHTGRAMFGIWRRWSPGSLDDRCFTKTWV